MVHTLKKISLILFFSLILGNFAVAPAQADFPASTGSLPYGITIDSAGNIYTANSGSNNVTKITPGGVSSILGTTGKGPYSITVDSAGNI